MPSDLIEIANCIWQLHMQLHIHILVHCTGKCRSLACTCTYQYECTCTCRSLSWYALVKNQPDDLFIVFSSDDGGARGQAFKDPDRGALSCGQLVILQRDAAGVYKVSSPVQLGKSVFQYLILFIYSGVNNQTNLCWKWILTYRYTVKVEFFCKDLILALFVSPFSSIKLCIVNNTSCLFIICIIIYL